MKAGVVIVNYNAAPYALHAALSVLGAQPDATVLIIDNASTDDSMAYFKSVFAGDGTHNTAKLEGAVSEEVSLAAVKGATKEIIALTDKLVLGAGVYVCANAQNRGFAAGCNAGLSHLKKNARCDWYLLLNPDAVVTKGSMQAFKSALEDSAIGLCGASVLEATLPHRIQALGGARLNPITLMGENLRRGEMLTGAHLQSSDSPHLSYPLGAAMAFRPDYLDRVGFLDERFFLYYEEADWARRGLPEYKVGWAREAIVYHRHGISAGSRLAPGRRSRLSEFHMARSRLLYCLKWAPFRAPMIVALEIARAINRMFRGDRNLAAAVLSGAAAAFRSLVNGRPGASADVSNLDMNEKKLRKSQPMI